MYFETVSSCSVSCGSVFCSVSGGSVFCSMFLESQIVYVGLFSYICIWRLSRVLSCLLAASFVACFESLSRRRLFRRETHLFRYVYRSLCMRI